jgi:putative SbcD/Mre11-related phosphoesterase
MPDAPVPPAVSDLTLRDRGALVEDTLVIADLHLGQGSASQLEFPVGNGARTVERVEGLLEWTQPTELVLAGDVLHAFGTVPHTVTDALDSIAKAAEHHGASLVVLEGNHDTMLATVWDGSIRDEYRVGETVICHGHEEPSAPAERYVMGHEHPVLSVAGRRRPTYLAGDAVWQGADLLVLPPFSQLLRGVEINDMDAAEFMSPLIEDADSLQPVVWDDDAGETLHFPPLGTFRNRL